MAKKILAVDDERHIVRLIQVNLQRAGYEVIAAYDGRDALEKAKAEKPDLIVLDTKMPYMDGDEVLRALKADPETAEIPVIMLGANGLTDFLRGSLLEPRGDTTAPPRSTAFVSRPTLRTLFPWLCLLAAALLVIVRLVFHI